MLDEIESFLKEKLAFNELSKGVELLKDGKVDDLNSTSERIKEAISFSFDNEIGLDLFSDVGMETMYEHLHTVNSFVPTGIERLDDELNGGVHRQSVTVFLAESNMGKTLIKTAIAANMILQNKKVTYITFELSQEYIGERILKNIFDLSGNDLKKLSKEEFQEYYKKLCKKMKNLLIIKKYPAGTANANHLKRLLKDLETKKKFKTDIIFLDYLGIFAASKVSKTANSNDKGIAKCQELEALSDEFNLPIVTSAQANRSGYGSSSLDPTNIADAIGIFTETDVVIAVTQTEEQRELNPPLFTWQLLKNRFGINKNSFSVGVIYEHMRLINVDDGNENSPAMNISTTSSQQEDSIVNDAVDEISSSLSNSRRKKRNSIIDFN
ncbi:MAG: DnaB-like helicase C-terminal domain-containing protein [bacterium]